MNIYCISWLQNTYWNLSSVIIAPAEDEALKELDLDLSFNSNVKVDLIGTTIKAEKEIRIVCLESL